MPVSENSNMASTTHQLFVIGVVLAMAFYDRTSADELIASGSSTDANERVQRLEMQMSRLQVSKVGASCQS